MVRGFPRKRLNTALFSASSPFPFRTDELSPGPPPAPARKRLRACFFEAMAARQLWCASRSSLKSPLKPGGENRKIAASSGQRPSKSPFRKAKNENQLAKIHTPKHHGKEEEKHSPHVQRIAAAPDGRKVVFDP